MADREPLPRTIPAEIRIEALQEAFQTVRRKMVANRTEAMAILHEIAEIRIEQKQFEAKTPKPQKLPEIPSDPEHPTTED